MYNPRHFKEDRIDVLAGLIRNHPLATLVSLTEEGLFATHLPMLWDPEPAPYGMLTGHIARPNPHRLGSRPGFDSLAIFQGPAAYVSPSWYPSKREHGKVVPTWNYAAVHAYGPLSIIDDADWVRAFVTRLTEIQESGFADPWKVSDAPEPFLAQMVKGIVGLEIPISRLEGKWKLSQNRTEADYAATIEGLGTRDDSGSKWIAEAMTALRRER